MKVLEWIARPFRRATPPAAELRSPFNTIPSQITAANVAGVVVNERSALTLTAAYACINVVATDTAFLPRSVYQWRSDGSRIERKDHPAYALLNWSPDQETTPIRQQQAWMGHCLGWGNGLQEIERDLFGRPIAFHLLDPQHTQVKRRKTDNRLYYHLESGRNLRPSNVLHLAGLGYDGLLGYSPVKLARQAIGLGLAAETFGAALFGNGAHPGGSLEIPGVMSDEAYKRLRESFEEVHQGAYNAHRVALLEEGAKWVQTSVNPEDAQFLATRKFQVEEVCRIYRVPLHLVANLDNAHLANIEATQLIYYITVLGPWCAHKEQEMNFKLFTEDEWRDGFHVEHDLTRILRGDSKARAEYYTKMRDLGVLSPNQISAFENLGPLGKEGDIRLVPMNMTTLAKAGQNPTPNTISPKGAANDAA
jgi:HK97 family phage portal protein